MTEETVLVMEVICLLISIKIRQQKITLTNSIGLMSLTGLSYQYAWIWLLWLLSQTWITLHIWTPKCERLASTEKLFVSPMYNCLLIDQSLALNRRRDDDPEVKADEIQTLSEDNDLHEVGEATILLALKYSL